MEKIGFCGKFWSGPHILNFWRVEELHSYRNFLFQIWNAARNLFLKNPSFSTTAGFASTKGRFRRARRLWFCGKYHWGWALLRISGTRNSICKKAASGLWKYGKKYDKVRIYFVYFYFQNTSLLLLVLYTIYNI